MEAYQISEDTIARWVNEKGYDIAKVQQMADSLGLNLAWLLEGPPHPERLNGTPLESTEPSTLIKAQHAHRQYVVERLIADGIPRELVERVVPSGAEMVETSLSLCRETIDLELMVEEFRQKLGEATRTTSTHTQTTVIGPWGEFKL